MTQGNFLLLELWERGYLRRVAIWYLHSFTILQLVDKPGFTFHIWNRLGSQGASGMHQNLDTQIGLAKFVHLTIESQSFMFGNNKLIDFIERRLCNNILLFTFMFEWHWCLKHICVDLILHLFHRGVLSGFGYSRRSRSSPAGVEIGETREATLGWRGAKKFS